MVRMKEKELFVGYLSIVSKIVALWLPGLWRRHRIDCSRSWHLCEPVVHLQVSSISAGWQDMPNDVMMMVHCCAKPTHMTFSAQNTAWSRPYAEF
jgi:hypothetical protein